MTLQEYQQLHAEQGALNKLLEKIPVDRVIDRMGLEARREEIEEKLRSQPTPSREPVRTRLTFRGKPIAGSHGIFAEFGAAAVATFADAVAAIGANTKCSLGARGTLPNRNEFRMLITGTAQGSFGFQLEEAAQENLQLFPEQSPLADAIAQTQAIMRASLGTDEQLTEALADIESRAVDALRKFLEELDKHEAICALEYKDELFRFEDVEQLRRCAKRLRTDNIHEADEVLEGTFLGVLPKARTFEFQVGESPVVVRGKVGQDIEDAMQINSVIGKPVTITVRSKRVGEGNPRYVLLSFSRD